MFESYRGQLEGVAYRILGSIEDAQDVAQETWIQWNRQESGTIHSERSWLLTVCSRLALDRLKSSQRRRERYVGPWLPEPWLVDERSPAERVSIDESLMMAMMLVMDALSPVERACFLLHDVFDISFDEIGLSLEKDSATCRKAASRAREKLRRNRPRFEQSADAYEAVADTFFDAIKNADVSRIESLLANDVRLIADSDGKASATKKVLTNPGVIVSLLLSVYGRAARQKMPLVRSTQWFSGAPGSVFYLKNQPVAAYQLAIREGKIHGIYVIRNPDKLRFFDPL